MANWKLDEVVRGFVRQLSDTKHPTLKRLVTEGQKTLEIRSKKVVLELSPQQMEDLLSAVSFTMTRYPKDSPNFLKSIEALKKKLWAAHRKRNK